MACDVVTDDDFSEVFGERVDGLIDEDTNLLAIVISFVRRGIGENLLTALPVLLAPLEIEGLVGCHTVQPTRQRGLDVTTGSQAEETVLRYVLSVSVIADDADDADAAPYTSPL